MSEQTNTDKRDPTLYLYDVETFYDYFCAVFKVPGTNPNKKDNYLCFEISEFRNDAQELYKFLSKKPKLIGYNTLGFDSQVLEIFMQLKGRATANDLYNIAQKIIGAERPVVSPWKLKHVNKNLDLMKMWGYGRGPKSCSLKWLEFSMRLKRMKDLPYDFRKKVKTESAAQKIMRYCMYDVEATEEFYNVSKGLIKRRVDLSNTYPDFEMFNIADQNIGEDLFLDTMSRELGINKFELRKMRTIRKKVAIKDAILPYVKFETKVFQDVLDFYNKVVIDAEDDGSIILKNKIKYVAEHPDCHIEYGAGGIHASKTGLFKHDNEHEIWDWDVASYYPNLSIKNGFYPEHLTRKFCHVYEDKYNERKTYDKGTPMNVSIKLMLNAAFGKSKSLYSFFYDPMFFMQITINGQLLLSMLAEKLSRYGCELLQLNTDGLTVRVHKSKVEVMRKICVKWEELTQLELESAKYSTMALNDVNNYLAIYDGPEQKIKRKGRFEIYEDITGSECFYKNTSASIIPKALNNYFVYGIKPEETIYSEDNIYEFLYGERTKRNFKHVLAKSKNDGTVDHNVMSDRVLRFYMSTDGSSLKKFFNDFRVTSINKQGLITPLQYVRSPKASIYTTLDRQWYIDEVYSILQSMQIDLPIEAEN